MVLIAKNQKELDICLKFLYSQGLNHFPINVSENEKGKLIYEVVFSVDEEMFNEIKSKYDILIV